MADQQYPLPHVGLADVQLVLGATGAVPYTELLAKAKAELTVALALDPDVDEAWTLMAVVHFYEWDFDASERAVAKAIEINPRLGHAHSVRACNEMFRGRPDRAVPSAKLSVELDPLAMLWNGVLAYVQLARGDRDASRECVGAMLDFDPESWMAYYVRGLLLVADGRPSDAIAAFEKAVRFSGDAPLNLGPLACACGLAGDPDRARRILDDLVARAAQTFVPALPIALAHIGLGDLDAAIEWLEKSLAERDVWVTWAAWSPLFAATWSDPRMQDFLRRMKRLQEGRAA